MKTIFTVENLINGVATFNADPYCIENEELASEILGEILDTSAIEITDEDERATALAKLDLPPTSERKVYQAGGCLFSPVGDCEYPEITTMQGLVEYINESEDWPVDVEDIIEENGWISDCGTEYGVCHNDTEKVVVNDEGVAECVSVPRKLMKGKLKNKVTGHIFPVTATTEHPDSSYGQAVWVDEEGQSCCIVGMPSPIYDVVEMEINNRESLAQYLHLMRVSQGISVRGMAEACGLSPSTVQNIEKVAFSPRLDILHKMLFRLGAKMKITIE